MIDQVIHCSIREIANRDSFFSFFIYAENDYLKRRELWECLRAHKFTIGGNH
ncbi:hypothetical protein Pint_30191 [Pistacia integerrima]|uniref:Uncharacterized protein n=1 Tax=Pistacia integerrima TaxID=434235 RepID=A0ACC0X0P5_9ROSI|nr:hypothetical protein Pint_30191 [Pistacia integerrima]